MDEVRLWHVRFMREVNEPGLSGAEPLWEIKTAAVPAAGDLVTLVRTIQRPEIEPGVPLSARLWRVTHRAWYVATGHEPVFGYGVDVYVEPAL